MKRLAFLFGAALLTITAACGDSGSKTTTTSGGATPTVASTGHNFGAAATVTLKNLKFEPATVTIKKGEQVEWVWQEAVAHNITSETFKSDSKTSGSFQWTFNTVGEFTYQCTLHQGMTGTVKVT